MPSYTYMAREAGTGREIRSNIDASSEQAAIAALLNPNLLIVSIQERIGKKGKTSGGKVALSDLVVFTRQLATMIDAGLAMVQSLQALAEQTSNKVMRDVIRDVCTRVEGGDSFSQALIKHPKVFNKLYVSMVDAGEKGGLLAEVLARLATYLENTARLRKKVKSAMMYPTAVTIVAIGITIFLLVKVVPVFGEIYSGFGAKLPGPTQFLIGLSNIIKGYILYILPAMGLAVYGWFLAIRVAATDIERGEGISSAIGKHSIFPSMIIRMMTAGEQTGKIDAMLERVADFLDEEIETTLAGLTSLIEPLLIVFLGVVVGGIVICMFLPIFKMSEIINPRR